MSLHEDESDLREFLATASRDSFNRIARRHLNFVYGIARREGGIDAHQAEDITQAVFIILARRASAVRAATLAGWFFTTTRHVAANPRRIAARWRHHEQRAAQLETRRRTEAAMQANPADATDADQLSAHLTAALAAQRAADRSIVLMRFVQGLEFAQIAQSLGLSDLAARKRLERALDRLREFLSTRGISAESSALSAAMGGVAQAAPGSLVAAISSAAPATAAAALAKSTLATIIWAPIKLAASIVLSVALATAVVSQIIPAHQSPPAPQRKSIAMNVAATAPPTTAHTPPEIAQNATPGTIVYTGVITDPTGKPVEGVRVWSQLVTADPSNCVPKEARTVTDAAGRYTLPPLPLVYRNRFDRRSFERDIRVDDPRYAIGWSSVWDGDDVVDATPENRPIRLEPSAAIRVKVVDEAGAPIAGADVVAFLEHQGRYSYPIIMGYGYLTVPGNSGSITSDERGLAVIPRVPTNARAELTITHPGYVKLMTRDSGGGAPIRPGDAEPYVATLKPGGQVRVQLDLASGGTLSSSMLRASSLDGLPVEQNNVARLSFDRDGVAIVLGLRPGRYDLQLPPEYTLPRNGVWLPVRNVTVRAGETTDVRFSFTPGVRVTGRLIDPRNKLPIARSDIYASMPPNDNDAAKSIDLGRVVSAPDGRFELRALPGNVKLDCANYIEGEYRSVTKNITVAGDSFDVGDIEVMPPLQLRGRLVDMDGNAVFGLVSAGVRARTAPDGSFIVQQSGGRRGFHEYPFFALSVDHKLGASMLADEAWSDPKLALPTATLPTVKLLPTANITGQIIDENGDAATDAEMSIYIELPAARDGGARAFGTIKPVWGDIERDGNAFAIDDLPVGVKYSISINWNDRNEQVELTDLQPGEMRDLGGIVMKPVGEQAQPSDHDATVRGTVLKSDGTPLSGALVRWARVDFGRARQTEDTTDHAGRFVLKELPKGAEVNLTAEMSGFDDATAPIVVDKDTDPIIAIKATAEDLMGRPAPEIDASEWLNGSQLRIADLRGKVVLLHIGVHLPSGYLQFGRELIDAAQKYAGKDLQIIAIHYAVDDPTHRNGATLAEIRDYLKLHPLPFPVAIDTPAESHHSYFGGQTKDAYQIRSSSPAMVIIDKNGIVRGVVKRGEVNTWIEKLLAEDSR
ncbi:hypothetical protein BH09PLA1_BH09PLA1_13490 [soil metagenome]